MSSRYKSVTRDVTKFKISINGFPMTFCLKLYKVYGNIAMGSIVFEIIFLFYDKKAPGHRTKYYVYSQEKYKL